MTNSIDRESVNSTATIVSGIALGTIGVLSFIVQPGLVQGFVTQLGLSEADANHLAFMEMLGIAIATYLSAVLTRVVNWRGLLAAALVTAMLGNILSMSFLQSPLLGAARFVTGLGEGIIISLSFTIIGLTQRTERNLALYLVLLLTYGALGLWVMPSAFEMVGLSGIFLFWAALSALALWTVFHIPRSSHDHVQPRDTAVEIPAPLRGLMLLGVLLFNLAIGIAWANLFLIGMQIEPDEQRIANALLLSQFVAIGGAIIPVFLEQRLGVAKPIAVTIAGSALAIGLLLGEPGYVIFAASVCLFNFLWNMGMPFILSAVGETDLSGTMITNAIAMQMTGLGFGPFLAAVILGQQGTFREVELLTVGLFALCVIPLFLPIRHHARLLARRRM